ncbi:restriction endonuclease subunit S [Helicobacter pylori]|uniref:restriction endonuclease subunit S n=1 Tax=Helicobacter pylori TaxID=210 RepID=UPI001FD4986F|nr:restriction endonuclease subunit S [Helicobacter pylori]UOR81918.1 restriction endonuclease subunit S [Helicobacter pylori]
MDALMLPLPKDWEIKTFRDISTINQGLQIPISQRLKAPTEHAKFYITIQALNNRKEFEYIKTYNESVVCHKDDILMTRTGNTGMVITNIEGVFHNNFFKINFDRTLINKDFLVYFLSLEQTQRTILKKAGTSTIPDLNHNDFYSLTIPLPPLNEQIIANILSTLDHYLCSLDALILKKESVKKALSFELLSQRKRLKGFNQAWQRVRLGDIGITISGLVGKTKQDFINGNAKYITFLNVLNNVIIDTSILENVKIYPNEKQNSFKKYDLFFNISSETPKEVGMCAVLLDDIDQVFLNSFCFGFRIFDKAVDSLFLSYLINSEIGRKAFENLAQGSTRYNLSKSGFNNVCLSLPPLNEQNAIANILSALDNEIASLKNKKRQFENIKKALNHDLMSAKIRVLKQQVLQQK